MISMKKKLLIGMITGAVLLGAGIAVMQGQAEAKEAEQPVFCSGADRQRPHQKMNADRAAKHIHEVFGVDEAEVKAAINEKKDFHDIGQAAMLAKISGKSFNEVLAMKTDNNDWREVSETLNVKPEQIYEQMNCMTAAKIAKNGNVSEDEAISLLNNGYRVRDIECAAILAQKSGKDIQSVLDMKKINNRWRDVAAALGVDSDVLHQKRRHYQQNDDSVATMPPADEPIDEGMLVIPQDNKN